jgi:hypothetical protein
MKKLIFIVILMVGLAYGQDSTVTQALDRFVVEMDLALDQIEDFQTQINLLRVRILALEYIIANGDTSLFTVEEIDNAIMSIAEGDTSKHTIIDIDQAVDIILGTPK